MKPEQFFRAYIEGMVALTRDVQGLAELSRHHPETDAVMVEQLQVITDAMATIERAVDPYLSKHTSRK